MTFIKSFIATSLLIILSACNINPSLSHLLNSNNYLLVETAIDRTDNDARAKALSLLAQDIFVKVQNNFSSKEALDQQGVFSTSATNTTTVDSSGYFKDVIFSEVENLGKKGYKVSVGLSSKALLSTITYLQYSLKIDSIDSLTNKDLQEEYNKTNFLIALILYAKGYNLITEENSLIEATNYQKALNLRLSSAAQITFNIQPNLNNTAKINIINKTYQANELIFLPPDSYYYTVFAKGYKTKTNRIELQGNDKLTLNIYLQKLLSSPIKVKLVVTASDPKILAGSLQQQIKNLLSTYQLQASDFTNNQLQINFLDISYTELNNYYYFNLPVEINLVKNDQVKISKTFDIQYVGSNSNSSVATSFIMQKLSGILEEITAGNNLNTAYK